MGHPNESSTLAANGPKPREPSRDGLTGASGLKERNGSVDAMHDEDIGPWVRYPIPMHLQGSTSFAGRTGPAMSPGPRGPLRDAVIIDVR